MAELKQEMEKYDDIVLIDTVDTYRNNIIKWNAIFQWHLRFCKNTNLFFKMDNDVVVNLERLVEWYKLDFDGIISNKTEWIICRAMYGNNSVVRDKSYGV